MLIKQPPGPPPDEEGEGEEGGGITLAAAAPGEEDKFPGMLTNPHATDYVEHTVKWTSTKMVTEVTMKSTNDVILESVQYLGPYGGTLKLKSKPGVIEAGKNNFKLSFDATASDGAKASDDKDVQVGATAKWTIEAWKGNASWGSILYSYGGYLDTEATTMFDEMDILSGTQKTTAKDEFKLRFKDSPTEVELKDAITAEVNLMEENPTWKFGAQSSAAISYKAKNYPVKINGGLGFAASYTEDSGTTFDWHVAAAIEVTLKKLTVGVEAKIFNLAPLGVENQSKAGGTVEVGLNVKF